jgi:hypothetical protein
MARCDVCRVQRLVNLGINPAAFCIPTRSIPLAALVAPVVRATTALAMVAHTCLGFLVRMGVCRTGALVGVSGGDSRLALRVALRALQLLEVFLLPGVHDHLSGRKQSRQRRLDHVGSILSECLVEI